MASPGQAVAIVTPADVRASMKALADEFGMIVSCTCGASRWCPAAHTISDSESFWKLHAGHRQGE